MDSTQLQVALSGAAPALIAMWLVDRLDAKRPEPPSLRRLAAIMGAVSVVPAIILEVVLSQTVGENLGSQITYEGSSFHAFIVAAAVEEACKFALVFLVIWHRPEFDERMDGIVYASRAGLGFALVENVMYLLNQTTLTGTITVWILRALLAVPGHAMWTGMIGAMAARRRFDGKGLGVIGGYLLAVAFHGAYDLSVFVQGPLHLEGRDDLSHIMLAAPVVLTLLAFLILRQMARTALRLDDAEAASKAAAAAARMQVPAGPMQPPPAY